MKILTFLARHFAWEPFSQTLDEATPAQGGAVDDAVIAFIHVELHDESEHSRVFRHTLKHLKWLANKKQFHTIVLHSFTHLGAENATPAYARQFFEELAQRLRHTGYTVEITPFGYFCSWQLDVYGESLAKVYKEIAAKSG
ncbi:MAG: hypothetical protein GXP37_06895 [Chloroflexi bacterium]|nr:hypothetical protein [Chloroflexota bacterium]